MLAPPPPPPLPSPMNKWVKCRYLKSLILAEPHFFLQKLDWVAFLPAKSGEQCGLSHGDWLGISQSRGPSYPALGLGCFLSRLFCLMLTEFFVGYTCTHGTTACCPRRSMSWWPLCSGTYVGGETLRRRLQFCTTRRLCFVCNGNSCCKLSLV